MDTSEVVKLVPPLTPAQIDANKKFQDEMRVLYALPQHVQNRDQHYRRCVAQNLKILTILQNQFERAGDENEKLTLSVKAKQLKIDICQYMAALGLFAEAHSLCPDENTRAVYAQYLAAENASDNEWCSHSRYIMGDSGKPQPNYYREFNYFSQKRGKHTSMTRCSECEMRNAVDVPQDLLDLDKKRQAHIDNHLAKNS